MDEKIVNILLDLLNESKITNQKFDSMDKRLEKLEKHAIKTNAAIGELRISVMRLADELLRVHEIDNRLRKVENKVFNIAS